MWLTVVPLHALRRAAKAPALAAACTQRNASALAASTSAGRLQSRSFAGVSAPLVLPPGDISTMSCSRMPQDAKSGRWLTPSV